MTGAENPGADDRVQFVIIGDEDAEHAGGGYVTTQRYATELTRWSASTTEDLEAAIGRAKGGRHRARRRDVPAGRAQGSDDDHARRCQSRAWGTTSESGTYFIACARDLSVTEDMLERMYVADADGVYDLLLDFTIPLTGTNFFAPSLDVLEALAHAPADVPAGDEAATAAASDQATLGIGDLRGRGSL